MSNELYFGPEVDDKIREFIACTDKRERDKIFNESIKEPFEKLITSQIRLYRFYILGDVDTLVREALTYLFSVIVEFDSSKGKKAFSYFNTVSKNYFIGKIREQKKIRRQQAQSVYGIDRQVVKNDPSMIIESHEDNLVDREFWNELNSSLDKWRDSLKKHEILVLDSIRFMLQNPSFVSVFSKKAIVIYLKDMTQLTPKQINGALASIRTLYQNFKEEFDNG